MRKKSMFTMRLDTINIYQNAWYKCHGKKGSTLYNYENMYLNGDVKVVYCNNGLRKSRSNIVAIIDSIN